MSLSINSYPRFIHGVVSNQLLNVAPLLVVDVGASLGASPMWQVFRDQYRTLGFEPHEEEFLKLKGDAQHSYVKLALAREQGKRTFYATQWPYSSSFLKPNMPFWSRFPNAAGFEVVKEVQVETVSLDHYFKTQAQGPLDVLKLDVEGAELEVLEGAEESLSSCLAIQLEVAFTRFHEGRAVFSEIDEFLRARGFSLYGLAVNRHARSALPPLEDIVFHPSSYGQVLWADALYMRDITADFRTGVPLPSQERLLKALCLYDLFSQPDSGIELFLLGLEQGAIEARLRPLGNLFVPPAFGRLMNYDEWMRTYATLPQRG